MTRKFLVAGSLALLIAACATTAAPPDQAAETAEPQAPRSSTASDALGVAGAIAKSILSLFSVTVAVH